MGRVYYTAEELKGREEEVKKFEDIAKEIFIDGYLGLLFDSKVISKYISIKYRNKKQSENVTIVLPFEYMNGDAVILINPDEDVENATLLTTRKSVDSFLKTVWLHFIRTVSGYYIPYVKLPENPREFSEANIGPLLKYYNKKTFPQDYSVNDDNIKYHTYPKDKLGIKNMNNYALIDDFYSSEILNLIESGFATGPVINSRRYDATPFRDDGILISQHANEEKPKFSEFPMRGTKRYHEKYKQIGENLYIDEKGIAYEPVSIPTNNLGNLGNVICDFIPAHIIELMSIKEIDSISMLLPVDWLTAEMIENYERLYKII